MIMDFNVNKNFASTKIFLSRQQIPGTASAKTTGERYENRPETITNQLVTLLTVNMV